MSDKEGAVSEKISNEEARTLDQVPCCHHVHVFTCGDHECGPHLVLFDEDNVPIIQAVLSPGYVDEFCEILQAIAPLKRKNLS